MHDSGKITRKMAFSLFWVLVALVLIYPLFIAEQEEKLADGKPADKRPIPAFSDISDTAQKKQAFFEYLLPEITRQNDIVMQERMFLLGIKKKLDDGQTLTAAHRKRLDTMSERYKVEEASTRLEMVTELIKRVDVIPAELVLAQAANESAWGTSRFAQNGYNFFGLWCFKKGCGFVPARRGEGSNHEVAKFRNLSHAVRTYLQNLNRHYAYEELRSIRASLRENQQALKAEALAQGLMRYSERGQDYVDELIEMIRFNRKYMQV